MAALLAKFRIDFSDVKVIPDVTKRAQDSTRAELTSLLQSLPEGKGNFFSLFFEMSRFEIAIFVCYIFVTLNRGKQKRL